MTNSSKKCRKNLQKGIFKPTEKNLLDIFHSIHYMQQLFQKTNPDIVGVAESEDAAKDLLIRITEGRGTSPPLP